MMQILKMKISLISNAAYTEVNVVTSLQIKNRKTHLLFVFDLKMYRKMRLCVIIKNTQSLLRLLGGLGAMNFTEFKTLTGLKNNRLNNSHQTKLCCSKSFTFLRYSEQINKI